MRLIRNRKVIDESKESLQDKIAKQALCLSPL